VTWFQLQTFSTSKFDTKVWSTLLTYLLTI
jgi:hypothetical protein